MIVLTQVMGPRVFAVVDVEGKKERTSDLMGRALTLGNGASLEERLAFVIAHDKPIHQVLPATPDATRPEAAKKST